MLSVIEVPKIPRGEYELELSMNKILFLDTTWQTMPYCLSFDLMLEYVVRAPNDTHYLSEVLGIYPAR